MSRPWLLAIVWLAAWSTAAPATDLTKIDRTIAKEPAYKSKPRYCLLVFGPEAKTRVWLVRDGDVLYVDRNGNGDLTEEGERVESRRGVGAIFHAGDITETDGKTKHTGLMVNFERNAREHFVDLTVQVRANYTYCAFVGPSTERPQDAPIVLFNGPLTMSFWGNQVLVRGDEPRKIHASIVTADPKSGQALRGPVVYNWEIPGNIHPLAEIEFPNKKPGEQPIKIKVLLTRRD